MVGWQLSRIRCETMWLVSGISEAFYYVGWPAEQVPNSNNVVNIRGGVRYVCWYINSGMKP